MVIGIDKNDLTTITFNFVKEKINVITGDDDLLFEKMVNPLMKQIIDKKVYNNIVINAGGLELDETITKSSNYVDNNYDNIFNSLINYLDSSNKKFEENNKDKAIFTGIQKVNCMITGINEFKNKLSDENQNKFDQLFNDDNELRLINFTIIDTTEKIKRFAYDSWFKDNYNSNSGIFLGNGVEDQMLINIGKRIPDMKEDVPYNFGFVIKRGTPSYVKFVEKYKEN